MIQNRLMKVLLSPIISEKSARIGERNRQYAFKVARDASKPEIHRAVEALFDVKVEGVQVVNVRGKVKQHKQSSGKRPDWKKAYVKLQEGQEIDFAGTE